MQVYIFHRFAESIRFGNVTITNAWHDVWACFCGYQLCFPGSGALFALDISACLGGLLVLASRSKMSKYVQICPDKVCSARLCCFGLEAEFRARLKFVGMLKMSRRAMPCPDLEAARSQRACLQHRHPRHA